LRRDALVEIFWTRAQRVATCTAQDDVVHTRFGAAGWWLV
jgi:hypothetical protein